MQQTGVYFSRNALFSRSTKKNGSQVHLIRSIASGVHWVDVDVDCVELISTTRGVEGPAHSSKRPHHDAFRPFSESRKATAHEPFFSFLHASVIACAARFRVPSTVPVAANEKQKGAGPKAIQPLM